MDITNKAALKAASPYEAVMTREQFLFYEMRVTAKLACQNLTHEEILKRIIEENLYQYPTQKSTKGMVLACLRRLEALGDHSLVVAIAEAPSDIAKQICLYAMMKRYRLIWDFMITVIGDKYRNRDFSFGRIDVNTFFLRLQEQDDWVASWSDNTITKLKQVIIRMLVDNDYLDSTRAAKLNPVLLHPELENAIRRSGDIVALQAFNRFN